MFSSANNILWLTFFVCENSCLSAAARVWAECFWISRKPPPNLANLPSCWSAFFKLRLPKDRRPGSYNSLQHNWCDVDLFPPYHRHTIPRVYIRCWPDSKQFLRERPRCGQSTKLNQQQHPNGQYLKLPSYHFNSFARSIHSFFKKKKGKCKQVCQLWWVSTESEGWKSDKLYVCMINGCGFYITL